MKLERQLQRTSFINSCGGRSSKKLEHYTRGCWEAISKNLTSVVNLENDRHCLRLLQISYNHLPVYLKPCFLYMGVFEEDDEIKVSTLIQLWICEGFLRPINGKSLETIAQGFFKDLVDRNLIMISRLGSVGNIKYCKIHDLLRDLCLNLGMKDGFYHVIGQCSPRGINCQRRVVIPRNTSKKKVLDDLQYMSHARSIICEYGKVPQCRKFGLLKTLHAYKFRRYGDESYDNSVVFRHVNLRYLAVEARSMSTLLSSVSLFWNLHTLIVSCMRKSTVPTEIWIMPQLRRIEFVKRGACLPNPPSDVVILENLHILKGVENFKCCDEENSQYQELGIKYHGHGAGMIIKYYLRNISCLRTLESFNVACEYSFRGIASLHNLTFPHSLKKLSLQLNFEFEWEDMLEKIASLPHLEKLKLFCGCFRTCKWEIVEGQFSNLKYLGLFSCCGLKQWMVEESSVLPRLEQLRLFDLQELNEIPSEIGNTPTLKKLSCSESVVVSAKDILDEQVELQGDCLSLSVEIWLAGENKALQSLAAPNFIVVV